MEIPVIDLERFTAEHGRLLVAACEGPGCFRVAGHGIPGPLMAEMKAAVQVLFNLPEDVKLRNADVIMGSGYIKPTEENPLYESFGLYDASSPTDVDAFCSALQAAPRHREVIKAYAARLHGLAVKIASKIAESTGVDGCSFEGWPCQFRLNKYSFTEDTVGSCGVQIHTDSGFLTVLQEDDLVGGLEAMIDTETREYTPIDPVSGTLLVNLGDIAKAWSNGRLHNLKHRVQCKEATVRISIALFLLGPPKDINVEPPAVFVDSQHPPRFQPFTYEQLRNIRMSTKSHAGEALTAYDLQLL